LTKSNIRPGLAGNHPQNIEPVQKAINEFVKRRPRYWDATDEHIAKAFCRLYQKEKPLGVQIQKESYHVYSDRTHENIYFRLFKSPNRKIRENEVFSISNRTFIQDYIPEAKERIASSEV